MSVKICCVVAKSSDGRARTRFAKWKSILIGRDGSRGSCGKKTLNCQMFIVGYLQFVERKHLQAAV
jgi:hypothetical protein